jgi:hypothetical protein
MYPRHDCLKQASTCYETLKPIQSDTATELIKLCNGQSALPSGMAIIAAADVSEANGLRNLKCRDPLKWILSPC